MEFWLSLKFWVQKLNKYTIPQLLPSQLAIEEAQAAQAKDKRTPEEDVDGERAQKVSLERLCRWLAKY